MPLRSSAVVTVRISRPWSGDVFGENEEYLDGEVVNWFSVLGNR